MRRIAKTAGLTLAILLTACGQGSQPKPGEVDIYDGIGEGEVVNLSGTEPFWSATIEGTQLAWLTPESPLAATATVTRFAGNGGLGFSATLEGQAFHAAVTPGDCSDGMSDRTYPFTATITLGETMLTGCGYTSEHPFRGEGNP